MLPVQEANKGRRSSEFTAAVELEGKLGHWNARRRRKRQDLADPNCHSSELVRWIAVAFKLLRRLNIGRHLVPTFKHTPIVPQKYIYSIIQYNVSTSIAKFNSNTTV